MGELPAGSLCNSCRMKRWRQAAGADEAGGAADEEAGGAAEEAAGRAADDAAPDAGDLPPIHPPADPAKLQERGLPIDIGGRATRGSPTKT